MAGDEPQHELVHLYVLGIRPEHVDVDVPVAEVPVEVHDRVGPARGHLALDVALELGNRRKRD